MPRNTFREKNDVSQVELLFYQVPGTIPGTDAPSEPLPPFYSGEAGFTTPRCVSAKKGGVLTSAERFMSVKTKVPELYRSFTRSWKLLAAPWDTKA